MVTNLNPKAIRLPRVEREKFVELMHLGLDYKREQGIFCIKDYNDIEKLMDAIGAILKTEVAFMQNCTRCGRDFACSECKYIEMCATKNLPFTCVCPKCLRDRKQFEQYIEKF